METPAPSPRDLDRLLAETAAQHRHLCPRQVLGVRVGLLAGSLHALTVPQPHASKRLLTIVETDGCFATGVSIATGCFVGRRTLRVEDYGKLAATCIDTHSGTAWRILPRPDARAQAAHYAPHIAPHWQQHLYAYQHMPNELLLLAQRVSLTTPIEQIISSKRHKARCEQCHEEINNQREVLHAGRILCRSCAGNSYYRLHSPDP